MSLPTNVRLGIGVWIGAILPQLAQITRHSTQCKTEAVPPTESGVPPVRSHRTATLRTIGLMLFIRALRSHLPSRHSLRAKQLPQARPQRSLLQPLAPLH